MENIERLTNQAIRREGITIRIRGTIKDENKMNIPIHNKGMNYLIFVLYKKVKDLRFIRLKNEFGNIRLNFCQRLGFSEEKKYGRNISNTF